jgi:hypothetical protein
VGLTHRSSCTDRGEFKDLSLRNDTYNTNGGDGCGIPVDLDGVTLTDGRFVQVEPLYQHVLDDIAIDVHVISLSRPQGTVRISRTDPEDIRYSARLSISSERCGQIADLPPSL